MLTLIANTAFGAPTDPAGWTALESTADSSARGAASRKTASSEPSSYSWTSLQNFQAARGLIFAYRNVGTVYDSSLGVDSGTAPVALPSTSRARTTLSWQSGSVRAPTPRIPRPGLRPCSPMTAYASPWPHLAPVRPGRSP